MVTRRIISGIMVVLLVWGSLAEAKMRDVKAIGEAALRKGKITAPAAGRDFTKIKPGVNYKEGCLLVRFEPKKIKGKLSAMSTGEKKQILKSLDGAKEKRQFDIVPGLSVVELPAGMTVEKALKKFNKKSGIMYAVPDYELKASSTSPGDPNFDDLWGMHNTGQTGGTTNADINAPEAWDIGTGNGDIVVAVIDTGIDYRHPDLAANMWVNTGEIPDNGIDDDENGHIDDIYGYDFCNYDGDPMDDCLHGTHCAGTIGAAGHNNEGVVGVCWNIKIMALKFLDSGGSGWTSDAIECVNYSILMGAHLSSNSYGGSGDDPALEDAIEAAETAGMLFVAAAGNSGLDNDQYPNYPSNYDCNNIIAVLATTHTDVMSGYSNYGLTTVDLGAPGGDGYPYGPEDILSTFPTYTTDEMAENGFSEYYEYIAGTSMATPHVAGTCALLWSRHPELSYTEVKDIVLESVDVIPDLNDNALFGKTCVTGGRLNLYKTLTHPNLVTSEGFISFNRDYYTCDDEVKITLMDSDILDANQAVYIETSPGGDMLGVNLLEAEPNVFKGTISTDGNTVDPNDSILQLSDGDIVTVTYYDANNGMGNPAEVNDTAEADCEPPVISGVTYSWYGLIPGSLTVAFETNEPTLAKVLCGSDCNDPCDIEASDWIFSTEHSIELDLDSLSTGNQYHFIIEATDRFGNVTVDNNSGSCYSFTTFPRDIYVPGDFNLIQEAISDSDTLDGCIVWVSSNPDDEYEENIYWNGKAITVRKDPNEPNEITISGDGDPNYPAVWFPGEEDNNTVLMGFTISGGCSGVWCYGSWPTVTNCTIEGYDSSTYGGIVHTGCNNYDYSLVVKDCNIHDNYYGARIDYGDSIFEDNQIHDNTTGIRTDPGAVSTIERNWFYSNSYGIYSASSANATIRNNLMYNNAIGARALSGSTTSISNNTIANNTIRGIMADANTTIFNCIIWNTNDDLYGGCSATYSCIKHCDDASGTGNICGDANDPCFMDVANHDYHLKWNSPCIDKGDPNFEPDTGETDLDGKERVWNGRVDMGAYEFGKICNITQKTNHYTIQEAVNKATTGDKIVLSPGVYTGAGNHTVDFMGKAITVRSVDPNNWDCVAATIIDCNGSRETRRNGFLFWRLEDYDSILAGLTITNGYAVNFNGIGYGKDAGGAIYCEWQCTPTIRRCIFKNNMNDKTNNTVGGAIATWWSEPNINDCLFYDNDAKCGGAIYLFGSGGSTMKIRDCIFWSNSAVTGGAIDNYAGNVVITNCTIVNNSATNGGGIHSYSEFSPLDTIANCILWYNGDDLGGNCSATYSCIQDGDEGNGNISSVPCLTDDFHLRLHSPCINTGTNTPPGGLSEEDIDCDPRIIDGTVDMGADEVPGLPDAHWWKLDEYNGVTAYDSVDNNDGTFNGNDPCWVAGLFGYAVDFNGTYDYFSVPSLDDEYNNASVFTVTGWLKTSQSTGMQTIVGQWGQGGTGTECWGWQVLVENNKVKARFMYSEFTMTDITGTSDVNDYKWHQFAMVRNGTSTALYVDGEPENSGTANFDVYSTKFRIGDGSYVDNPIPPLKGGPFNGIIDDVMIFDEALSAKEVEQLYLEKEGLSEQASNPNPANEANDVDINPDLTWTAGEYAESHDVYFGETNPPEFVGNQTGTTLDVGVLKYDTTYYWRIDEENAAGTTTGDVWSFTTRSGPNPDIWWKLDESSGTTAYDCVGDDDGTFNGDDPCWGSGAVDLNGVYDYFSVSSLDNEYSSSDTFTVTGWFKTSETSGMQTIVGQWSQCWEAGQEYFGWQVLVYNNKVVARFGYGIPTPEVTGTTDVNDGEWHHFAMVRNGTSTALYVDGDPEDSDTVSFYVYNTKFRIGDGSYKFNGNPALKGGPFNGMIDDVMIFDRVLSAEDVEQIYEEKQDKRASNPDPPNGATGVVGINVELTWTAGEWAESHDVYFGETNPPEFAGNQTDTTFNAGTLDCNTTYYWRIDEKSDAGTTMGNAWSFATWSEFYQNIAHWWNFNECNGTTAHDSVGDSDGTFNGDDPSWVGGLSDCAVDYNGVNDYFSVSSLDDEYSSSDTFTVAGWFRTSETSGMQTIVGQWSQCWEAGQEYFGWQVLVYNNKVVARFGYGLQTPDVTGTTTVTNGEWHHFAMVRNGTSTALYVDGDPEDSDTVSFYVYNTKFRIGDGSYKFNGNPALKGGPFDGTIDEVMIFDSALSAEEVEELYDAYGL